MTSKIREVAGHASWTLARFFERLAFACMGRDREEPDADLLALIEEFNSLTELVDSKYRGVCTSTEEHEAALTAAPLEMRQVAMLAGICSMHAVTGSGLRARAASLLLWDSGIRRLADAPDNTEYPLEDRMLAALLRDLMDQRYNR
jgi:hypothetical protein